MELTIKEHTILKEITKIALSQMGGKCPADLIKDNYSWTSTQEIHQNIQDQRAKNEIPPNHYQISGVVSSLIKKGLVICEEKELSLSDKGINAAIKIYNK